jgi:hypothetical protein
MTAHPDPIPGLVGMDSVRIRVVDDPSIDAIEVTVSNGGERLRLVLSSSAGIDMALRLIAACNRLAHSHDD